MRGVVLKLMAAVLVVPVLAGCVGTETDPNEDLQVPPTTIPPVPVLDGAEIVAKLTQFASDFPKRNANGPDHNAARDFLATEMQGMGLEVLRQTFEAPVSQTSTPTNAVAQDGTLQNVIGIKWGRDNASWVVIGGHYDTTDAAYQGFYDDGSGTIMTLELARAFADLETEKTIAFTMFDGEEQGLQGSKFFTESLANGGFLEEFRYEPEIFAMIDLDMFGINWPANPPIYFDENNDGMRNFTDEVRKDIGIPDDKFLFRGIQAGRSDYHWFWQMGVPTVFFISAFEEYYVGDVAMPECQDLVATSQCFTYPFWHRMDTRETAELMAGDAEKLEQGFTVATKLAGDLLHHVSTTPGLTLEVRAEDLPE